MIHFHHQGGIFKVEQRKRNTEALRKYLLKSIYQSDGFAAAQDAAKVFAVSLAAVYKQLDRLEQDGLITSEKIGRIKRYSLVDLVTVDREYPLQGLNEDTILSRDMAAILDSVTIIARSVFSYVFTEMLNNAIDHSGSDRVAIHAHRNAYAIGCEISDQGIGIFSKIQHAAGLEEKRFAILELAKGKFTTDPSSHSGEGVFFSSKVADRFFIISDELAFVGDNSAGDTNPVMLDKLSETQNQGTLVYFEVVLDRTITYAEVVDRYSEAPEDYRFSKTIVPVRLLEYRDVTPVFVSRSQAKRLLTRFERFKNIVLDFKDIEEIGQGFADEVFRVFVSQHPDTTISYINVSSMVDRMIKHAQSAT
ncbi:MAG TPA: ArsR family transcriptional regulator [Bacteroidales bacterium]|nr:ArsR family transcriptional regulator [Bacteroidales bacterium]